jgi:transcriptional regulator with XRE-family HTH domain
MIAALESPSMGQKLNLLKMRELRLKADLSQGDAAKLAGMTGGASQWSDVENGRKENVTLDTLSKIASALGCDARDLILPPDTKKKKRGGK